MTNKEWKEKYTEVCKFRLGNKTFDDIIKHTPGGWENLFEYDEINDIFTFTFSIKERQCKETLSKQIEMMEIHKKNKQ